MLAKILLLDDDINLNNIMTQFLKEKNYDVDNLTETALALEKINSEKYDLIILDIMLRDLDGINICLRLRKQNIDTPILLITALQNKSDLIKGFKAGADDYLIKPFDWEEFLLRIEALIKRNQTHKESTNESLIKIGDLTINLDNHQVLFQNTLIELTATEFKIFSSFLENPSKIFSADNLIEICWDLDGIPTNSTIRSHIKKLRKKLQEAGANHDLIETVYGVGYRINSSKTNISQPLKEQRKQITTQIDQLFEQFKDSLIKNINSLKEYVEGNNNINNDEAVTLAHNLAGTLGNFSFLKDTSSVCSEIENQLKNNLNDKLGTINKINQVYDQVTSAKSKK